MRPSDLETEKRQRGRRSQTVLGLLLAACGLVVIIQQPEHGATVALLFVGVGCGMIEPSLVKNIFKP